MPEKPLDGLPETISITALCWLLDVTPMRVGQLERDGVIEKAQRGVYTTESVRNFVRTTRQRGEGPRAWTRARTQLAQERAAAVRLGRLEKQGELVRRDVMREIACAIVAAARDRFLGLPAKLAHRLAVEPKPAGCERILYDQVCEILQDLSALEVVAERAANGRGRKAARRAGG